MKSALIRQLLAQSLPQVDPQYGQARPDGRGLHGDANETALFARQLEYVFTELYRFEYPDAIGRTIVPLDFSVPTGANSHTYRMLDQVGEATIGDSYATDVPYVDVKGQENSQKIVPIFSGFYVSMQDLRAAAMSGVPIDQEKAETARIAIEQRLDAALAVGESSVSLTGFANDANVTASALSGLTGTWSGATAAQIQADLELIAKTIFDQTLGIRGNPENGTQIDLVLPTTLYSILSTKRIDTYNMMTVLEYARTKMPMIKSIKPWGRLNTAGASNVARIVAFHNDKRVVQGIISQDFEIMPMQPKGFGWSVPCHMRFGGTVVRYPKGMRYIDGC
jgi:hypothetical protein